MGYRNRNKTKYQLGETVEIEVGYGSDARFLGLGIGFECAKARPEFGFHDWNYLLLQTGMLHKTELIAKIIRFIGTVLIFIGVIATFVFVRNGEEIVSEVNL